MGECRVESPCQTVNMTVNRGTVPLVVGTGGGNMSLSLKTTRKETGHRYLDRGTVYGGFVSVEARGLERYHTLGNVSFFWKCG